MVIIKNLSGEPQDDLTAHLDIERFEKIYSDDNTLLFHGHETSRDLSIRNQYLNHNGRKIHWNFEVPCSLYGGYPRDVIEYHTFDSTNFFDDLYYVCPYTAKWLNNRFSTKKFKPICYAYDEFQVPTTNVYDEKIYDVFFCGNIHSDMHVNMLNIIKDFNYNFYTAGFTRVAGNLCAPTGVNVPHKQIWSTIRKSKMSIVTNLLFIDAIHSSNIKQFDDYKDNEAFSEIDNIDSSRPVPQLKTRLFEAVFNKSLVLARHDYWNIIEKWFEPETEFIYYDEDNLAEIINDVNNNFDKYIPIIERAYERAVKNYGTDSLMKYILEKENLDWRGQWNW